MNVITLYHNPRCSKSREALRLLEEKQIEPEIRLYLDNPPSREELQLLLKKLEVGARQLLRSGEQAYKDHNLKDTSLTEEQLIQAMLDHPKLIERPIAIRGDRAVIGRPPENVLDLV
jgi:arsenate reductase